MAIPLPDRATRAVSSSARRWRTVATLVAVPLVLVVATWIPFGLSMNGLYEEWAIFGIFDLAGVNFFSGLDGPFAAQAARPLLMFPFALSYALDANSFHAMNAVLAGALVGQGAAFGFLTFKMTRSRIWGAIGGALILLQPADSATYAFRTLPTTFSLAVVLVACCLFVVAWDIRNRRGSLIVALTAGAVLLLAAGMYEAALTMTPLPLVALVVRDGFRAVGRQFKGKIWIIIMWVVAVPVYLAYAKWISTQTETYQTQIAGDPLSALSRLPNLFTVGVLRSLIGGWVDAAGILAKEYLNYWYLAAAVVLLVVALIVSVRRGAILRQSRGNVPRELLAVGFGVVMVILGYAPFLLNVVYQNTSQRTFTYTQPGAAMVVLGILMLIAHRSTVAAVALAAAIGVLGLGAHLFQFNEYVRVSETQKALLRGMIEQLVDTEVEGKTILILDASDQVGTPWMLHRENLPLTLSLLLDRPVDAIEICYLPNMEWQRWDATSRPGLCTQNVDGWTFTAAEPVTGPDMPAMAVAPAKRLTNDALVTIRIDKDGTVTSDPDADLHRAELEQGTTVAASRYQSMLEAAATPVETGMFRLDGGQDQYSWSFGDWWDLPVTTRGSGWRDAEWTTNPGAPRANPLSPSESAAWKSLPNSSILFDLAPRPVEYEVQGRFDIILGDDVQRSISIVINGRRIPITWLSSSTFIGSVGEDVLVDGTNTIEFNSMVKYDYYGLSAKLDSFQVNPKDAP